MATGVALREDERAYGILSDRQRSRDHLKHGYPMLAVGQLGSKGRASFLHTFLHPLVSGPSPYRLVEDGRMASYAEE